MQGFSLDSKNGLLKELLTEKTKTNKTLLKSIFVIINIENSIKYKYLTFLL